MPSINTSLKYKTLPLFSDIRSQVLMYNSLRTNYFSYFLLMSNIRSLFSHQRRRCLKCQSFSNVHKKQFRYEAIKFILKVKRVRTNIGLAYTLIPSSFIYFSYMGGTEPCDSFKIIFGNHVYSQHTIVNIKFGVNRMFHVVKTPVYRFDLYGRHRTLCTGDDNFWQCYLELVYKSKY